MPDAMSCVAGSGNLQGRFSGRSVHGEPESLLAMQKILQEEGVKEVFVPKHGETFTIA
jgi:hypothetical protein